MILVFWKYIPIWAVEIVQIRVRRDRLARAREIVSLWLEPGETVYAISPVCAESFRIHTVLNGKRRINRFRVWTEWGICRKGFDQRPTRIWDLCGIVKAFGHISPAELGPVYMKPNENTCEVSLRGQLYEIDLSQGEVKPLPMDQLEDNRG